MAISTGPRTRAAGSSRWSENIRLLSLSAAGSLALAAIVGRGAAAAGMARAVSSDRRHALGPATPGRRPGTFVTANDLRSKVANAPHTLREYSVIADGFRGGVIGPRGDLAWLCFPTWESPSVFDTLVGGNADLRRPSPQNHCLGRLLRGRHSDLAGPMGHLLGRGRGVPRGSWPSRPPAQRTVVLRTVARCSGARRGCGQPQPEDRLRRNRVPVVAPGGGRELDGTGRQPTSPLVGRTDIASPPGVAEPGSPPISSCAEGDKQHLVLELSEGPLDGDVPGPTTWWCGTEAAWHGSAPSCEATAAPRDARQAYAVLRGLSLPGGGTAAAMTTSLPERADQGRNYDYRYSWVRDQCFVGRGGGRGRRRSRGSCVPRSRSWLARLLEDGPQPGTGVHGTGRRGCRRNSACLSPATPAAMPSPATTRPSSSSWTRSGKPWLFSPRPHGTGAPRCRGVAGRRGRRRCHRHALARTRRRHMGARGPGTGRTADLPASGGLRSICAAGAPASRIGPWTALADAVLAGTANRLSTRLADGNEHPMTKGPTPRCSCRRCTGRRRPTTRGRC